ncbi:MAG TPA: lysylphosphatidylglycerol synthase domain-containing protein [Longimicrobiales bacterium]|nr:lysylphosphatidylglycerol synthase domain-containing protein [Longimicrobiales bacterium]
MKGRSLLVRLLQVALLAAVIWGIYRALAPHLDDLTWAELTRWRPATVPLVASFALLLSVYFAHALLWRRIMSDLSIGRPSFGATMRVYFLSSLGRYVPGKIWLLAGLAVLSRRAGLPPGSATAAALLGQFGFLTTGLLFLGLMLPEWRLALDNLPGGVPAGLPLALGAVLLITGGALIWLLVATPFGHEFRMRVIRRVGERAGERLGAAFALADRVQPRDAAYWAAGYALTWVAIGIAFALFAGAFYPPSLEASRYLAGTVAASYLIGYLLFVLPAGAGAREAAMFLLLQHVMPAGAALVVSILSRVWFTAAEIAPLALLPFLRGGRPGDTAAAGDSVEDSAPGRAAEENHA